MQLLRVFLAGAIWVVSSHGDQAVCVHVAHPAHVESGNKEVHSQLTNVADGNCRLVADT